MRTAVKPASNNSFNPSEISLHVIRPQLTHGSLVLGPAGSGACLQVVWKIMNAVEFRVTGLFKIAESIRERLPFAVIESGDVVIHSQLEPMKPLNEHLVWLWGLLKHERRFLKNLRRQGGTLICRCEVSGGTIRLLPNAAEMLHLLEVELVLEAR